MLQGYGGKKITLKQSNSARQKAFQKASKGKSDGPKTLVIISRYTAKVYTHKPPQKTSAIKYHTLPLQVNQHPQKHR